MPFRPTKGRIRPHPGVLRGHIDYGRCRTSSTEIAELLADGTISASVRAMWLKWDLGKYGLPALANQGSIVPVELTREERQRLERRAKRIKISPGEWLERVITCAIDDDMFGAITG